ncbi:MAG: hypothetical protein KJ709_04115 [Nanoarchaeota archaeon]|nr:hypothetical protein [Nanoarchaeota archaeon]
MGAIQPADIIEPEKVPGVGHTIGQAYSDIFGKAQYEWVVQRLVEESQREGEWTQVKVGDLTDLFKDFKHPETLRDKAVHEMMESGRIKYEEGQVRLTEATIKELHKHYAVGTLT